MPIQQKILITGEWHICGTGWKFHIGPLMRWRWIFAWLWMIWLGAHFNEPASPDSVRLSHRRIPAQSADRKQTNRVAEGGFVGDVSRRLNL